jgi:hypothetical protein
MKTDELIDVLSANLEAVDSRKVTRYLWIAVLSALAVALTSGVLALGVRWDAFDSNVIGILALKLAFCAAVVILGSLLLARHARPGGEFRPWMALAVVPFIAVMALAGVSLISAPASHWDHMMMGNQWLECLISIPIIAVLPFAVIMWAVRMAAPTDLVKTGALAGLVAGGVSALAYALHCADDSLPFVALWYGGTVILCTLAGGALGPRLLRW